MEKYVLNAIWAILLAYLLVAAYGFIRSYPGYDSTDDHVNRVRSGMRLYIDHGTGCHYLASPAFLGSTTLVPRMDRRGNHYCVM
jgi:hypothetical protein